MITAKEIADPVTMFWLLLCASFFLGLLFHAIRQARELFWTSVITVLAFDMLLYSTIYRHAPNEDAMWMIGLIIGIGSKFMAVFAAGLLVKRMRRSKT
jgi:hypothetical protein